MSDAPMFEAALQVEATAYATHPEGAVLPGDDDQADQSAKNEEK